MSNWKGSVLFSFPAKLSQTLFLHYCDQQFAFFSTSQLHDYRRENIVLGVCIDYEETHIHRNTF